MFKKKGRFVALLLAALIAVSSFSFTVEAAQAGGSGYDFNQLLEQMRADFFSPISAARNQGLERVYVESDHEAHIQPLFITPEIDGIALSITVWNNWPY
ncbi:MAG: hypothetical protein FWE42_06750 [Defluviitaleaceae bacterium]|nr:hypothetical protein [Defluviitaleaceae bacterium]